MGRVYTKIALLDHLGYGNLGDEATLDAVVHNIKCRWPHAVMIGLSLDPHDTQKRHGIASYAIRRDCRLPATHDPDNTKPSLRIRLKAVLSKYPVLLLVLRFIKTVIWTPWVLFQELLFLVESFRITRSLDLLIICGGGQLRDSWRGPWKFPYTLFKWVLLAKLLGVHCYFINVGAGPLETRLGRFLIMRALRMAKYISFRDEQSQLLIQRLGFKGKSHALADSVYGLPVPVHANDSGHRDSIVGISPMRVPWETCDDYSHHLRHLAQFGVCLARSHYRLQLFGTDIWYDSQAIADLYIAIKETLDPPALSRITCPPIDGVKELLSQLSSMEYIVTCRFHGVVFAHIMNIPVLAISHHPKVATLMNDIGLSDYCLDTRTFDFDQLNETFDRLVNNAAEVKSRMAGGAARYQRELALQFDSLFSRELDWSKPHPL